MRGNITSARVRCKAASSRPYGASRQALAVSKGQKSGSLIFISKGHRLNARLTPCAGNRILTHEIIGKRRQYCPLYNIAAHSNERMNRDRRQRGGVRLEYRWKRDPQILCARSEIDSALNADTRILTVHFKMTALQNAAVNRSGRMNPVKIQARTECAALAQSQKTRPVLHRKKSQ